MCSTLASELRAPVMRRRMFRTNRKSATTTKLAKTTVAAVAKAYGINPGQRCASQRHATAGATNASATNRLRRRPPIAIMADRNTNVINPDSTVAPTANVSTNGIAMSIATSTIRN